MTAIIVIQIQMHYESSKKRMTMGKCGCGFSTDPEGNCNGTHKVVKSVREKISSDILKNHLVDYSDEFGVSNHCVRGDCDHVQDSEIALGKK